MNNTNQSSNMWGITSGTFKLGFRNCEEIENIMGSDFDLEEMEDWDFRDITISQEKMIYLTENPDYEGFVEYVYSIINEKLSGFIYVDGLCIQNTYDNDGLEYFEDISEEYFKGLNTTRCNLETLVSNIIYKRKTKEVLKTIINPNCLDEVMAFL